MVIIIDKTPLFLVKVVVEFSSEDVRTKFQERTYLTDKDAVTEMINEKMNEEYAFARLETLSLNFNPNHNLYTASATYAVTERT